MSAQVVGALPPETRSSYCPGAEEIRMVRAIAWHGLRVAASYGEYHATFHGFRVQAIRLAGVPGFDRCVEVRVSVSFAGLEIECAKWATADPDVVEPKFSAAVIAM